MIFYVTYVNYLRYVKVEIRSKLSSVKITLRRTCVRTAQKAGSHADVTVPLERVKANVPSDDRTRQVVILRRLGVAVCRKLLRRTIYRLRASLNFSTPDAKLNS